MKGKPEMPSEIDINEVIKDEGRFRLYVAMKLKSGDDRMGRMETSLETLHNYGCAKAPEHAELGRRLATLEKDSTFAKSIAAAVGSLGGLITGIIAQMAVK